MNTTSNTRLRLTTQAGQDHAATGVLLALGTNNQLHGPENAAEYQLEPHRPTPVRPVSTTGQTGPCWWNLGTSTERPLHQSGWCSSPVRPAQARKPQIYQTCLPSYKLTQTWNINNTGQLRTHLNVHPSKTQQEYAPVRPVRGTCQTGVTWARRDEQHPRVNTPKSNSRSPESLHGFAQDFEDSRNTLWALHRQDFVHQNLLNREELKKSRQKHL
jgi:hypothetical protein